MNHTLHIEARNQPAVMERLLRVIRHRGFQITNLNVKMQPDASQIDIIVSVQSEKAIHLLENQLTKLFDVVRVSIKTPDAIQCTA